MTKVDPTKRYEVQGKRVDDMTLRDLRASGAALLKKFTREEMVPLVKMLLEEYARVNYPRGALSR